MSGRGDSALCSAWNFSGVRMSQQNVAYFRLSGGIDFPPVGKSKLKASPRKMVLSLNRFQCLFCYFLAYVTFSDKDATQYIFKKVMFSVCTGLLLCHD